MEVNAKRVAIVTGAAQGIGRGVALRLAADGFDVAINDLQVKSSELEDVACEIRMLNRRSIILIADVSEESEVKEMVSRVVEELGGLDVMVANAGVVLWKPLVEMSAAEFDRVLSVNARGTMLCYKYAAIQMVSQGRGGRIIGACSTVGKKGHEYMCAYAASKFAIRGITQSAALELATYGITVNAYAPGGIRTSLLESLDKCAPSPPATNGSRLKLLENLTPVGCIATPAVVANLVSYLISPGAFFITGQCLNINGGTVFD